MPARQLIITRRLPDTASCRPAFTPKTTSSLLGQIVDLLDVAEHLLKVDLEVLE